MKDSIHICCNIDINYIQYCIVMLTSLCENNKNNHFIVHIISAPLSPKAENELKQIEQKYSINLKIYYPQGEILKYCPIPIDKHISYASYYRCFLSVILPEEVHKLLYLDCDMIINGNIEELWDTDITKYAIGCVEDMWSEKADNYTRLNYPAEYSYFNAGVLLINLDYWRKHNVHLQVNEYLHHHANILRFQDQDVLNALFYDKKLFLPFRWNMQDGFFRRKRKIRKSAWTELDTAIKHPTVLHYTGGKKPWHYKSQHPYKSEYFKYLDMTPWGGWRPNIDYKFLFVNTLTKALQYTGIIKRKYQKIKQKK